MPRGRKKKVENFLHRGSLLQPILGSVVGNPDVIPYGNDFYLKGIMYRCRGFGLRHWRKLLRYMKDSDMSDTIIDNIKLSWCKFKFMAAITPEVKGDLLWIFKHFLTSDMQKCYQQWRDFYLDHEPETIHKKPVLISDIMIVKVYKVDLVLFRRLERYFNKLEEHYFLPLSCFPLIDPGKPGKMELAFRPYTIDEEMKKSVKDMVTSYLVKLEMESLFIPPPDILWKIGNQKYNDNGVPRFDYETPTSFDSSFLYQKFLASPLQMREVWLPGKGIKMNNTFWMIICRQFLSKDKRYPSPNIQETWERIKPVIASLDPGWGGLLRFDISGFGFQYLREWLEIGASAITELYPNSVLDEGYLILSNILSRVSVQMENGHYVYPPRGIGLGYYEDLKTIVMMAILDKFDPVSLYGDQGILRYDAIMAPTELKNYQFIIDDMKIEDCCSTVDKTIKWGGAAMSATRLRRVNRFSDDLIGAFFGRFHWERKMGLRAVMAENPYLYSKHRHKVICLYQRFFGYEFFRGEAFLHFNNCGVNMYDYSKGYNSLYKVQRLVAPYDNNLYDGLFLTPFKRYKPKVVPYKVGKEFDRKRRIVFRSTKMSDDTLYNYLHPVYEDVGNSPVKAIKMLPLWADLLYIVNYGRSSGSITYGLSPPAVRKAYHQYPFHHMPCKAAATGGVRPKTAWHRPPLLDTNGVLELTLLESVLSRDMARVMRADLPQDPYYENDPIYFNDDLLEHIVSLSESEESDEERRNALKRKVPSEWSFGFAPETLRARLSNQLSREIRDFTMESLGGMDPILQRHIINTNLERVSVSSSIFGDEEDIYIDEDFDPMLILED